LVERLVYTEDVGGSSPSSPTSLRRALPGDNVPNLDVRILPRRSCGATTAGGSRMKYAYIPVSEDGLHYYTSITSDLKIRLAKHNACEVADTSK
jgi:hypothetical protein